MSEYNVGDRVRVIGYVGTFWHGEIGVIENVAYSIYSVKFDGGAGPWRIGSGGFRAEELELIESASTDSERYRAERDAEGGDAVRKFSKGDRVRIIGESFDAIQDVSGVRVDEALATIVDYRGDWDANYRVLLDDHRLRPGHTVDTWVVQASDIELIVPVEACDAPAKSTPKSFTPAQLAAARKGDDRRANNDGAFIVDGEKVDVEAMFYRMCAKGAKKARRRAS